MHIIYQKDIISMQCSQFRWGEEMLQVVCVTPSHLFLV